MPHHWVRNFQTSDSSLLGVTLWVGNKQKDWDQRGRWSGLLTHLHGGDELVPVLLVCTPSTLLELYSLP